MLRVLIPSRNDDLLESCLLRPFVYARAINLLAQRNPLADLLIMGDDTRIVSTNWLTCCEQRLADWPEGFGMLNLLEPRVSIEHTEPQESPTTFAFVGTLIPRRIWNEIGPMDERYAGYGWDDTDYCIRVLHAGYKIGITGAAFIQHQGASTYGKMPNLAAMADHNRARFAEKWGVEVEQGFLPSAPHLRRKECHCGRPS